MYPSIVVPLDGSLLAEKALPHALELARCGLGRLLLLRVVPHSDHSLALAELGYRESLVEEERVRCGQAEKYLESVRQRPESEGLVADARVVCGNPANEILALEEADLIVISSHGRSGLGRYLMGSVATRILGHSRCPVMVVAVAG